MPSSAPFPRCPTCSAILPEGCGPLLCPACALDDPAAPSDEPADTHTRTQVGDYTLLRELGRGGMGVVYEARQEKLKRLVAVKVLPGAAFSPAEFRRQFQREAEAAARLRHPGIIAIHEVGEHLGQLFLAMEFVAGPSLADRLRSGHLQPAEAARLVSDVALAVAHAHTHGVIHRDLKPSNILLAEGKTPRLTDFGLARFIDAEATQFLHADALGSPNYLPPERTASEPSPAALAEDIYSLGAVLYHCLTGRPPFDADTLPALLAAISEDEPVAPRRLNRSVPADLETICLRCLEKSPSARYVDATAVADELSRFLRGEPVHARPINRVGKLLRWARRHPLPASLSTALALTILGGGTTSLIGWRAAAHHASAAATASEERRIALYSSNLAAASGALLATNNPAQARSFLDACLPKNNETDLRGSEWFLLHELLRPQSVFSTQAHAHILTTLAWNPAGDRLLSGSHDGSLKLWRFSPGPMLTLERELIAPGQPRLQHVEWLRDGSAFLTAEQGRFVRLRSADLVENAVQNVAKNAAPLWEIPGAQFSFAPAAGLLAVTTASPFYNDAGGRVSLWSWHGRAESTPILLETFPQHARSVALSPNSRYIAIAAAHDENVGADSERGVWLIDREANDTGKSIGAKVALNLPTAGPVWSLAFTTDSSELVTTLFAGSTDVLRFSTENGAPLTALSGHALRPWSVTLAAKSNEFITTSSDRSLRSWSYKTGAPTGRLAFAHENEIWSAALHPQGSLLATGDKDGVLKLFPFPLPTPRLSQAPVFKQFRYARPLFTPDSSHLITAADGSQMRLHTQPLNGGEAEPLTFADPFIGYDAEGHPLTWNRETRTVRRPNQNDAFLVLPATQNSDVKIVSLRTGLAIGGRFFFTLDASGHAVRLDLKSGRCIASGSLFQTTQMPKERDPFMAVELSPDGRFLALTSWRELILHDFEKGKTERFSNDPHWARAAAFSPDSKTLATAGIDGRILLRRLPDGAITATLRGHLEEASGLAFSPDGKTLVSSEIGLGLRFWRMDTLREVLELPRADACETLVFSPDGTRLALVISLQGKPPEAASVVVLACPR